jgi:hypothetical protein
MDPVVLHCVGQSAFAAEPAAANTARPKKREIGINGRGRCEADWGGRWKGDGADG